MSIVVDLTKKLGFEEKPVIKIKNLELKVNNSATSALQLMTLVNGEEMSAEGIQKAIELLFDAKGRKDLDKLELSLEDMVTVIETALTLIMGEPEGEVATLDTTS